MCSLGCKFQSPCLIHFWFQLNEFVIFAVVKFFSLNDHEFMSSNGLGVAKSLGSNYIKFLLITHEFEIVCIIKIDISVSYFLNSGLAQNKELFFIEIQGLKQLSYGNLHFNGLHY